MSRLRAAAPLGAGVLTLLAALAAAASAGARPPADVAPAASVSSTRAAQDQPGRARPRSVRTHGRLGYARVFSSPQRLPSRLREELDRDFDEEVNPEGPARHGPAPAGPSTPPTPDATDAATIRAAALPTDYQLFRSRSVAQGTGITTATGEPTVANDRNGLLFTGNTHAAVSADNGLSWQYLNPADASLYPQYDGGFCCDQVAYAVDRGPYSLVFWLRQFKNDGATSPTDGANGRLSLITFQGRGELLDQADFCEVDFKPSDFGFAANTFFDFNQVSNTKKFLYISSKAQMNLGDVDGDGSKDSRFLRGVVWRIALDDLDSDDCSPPVTAWSGQGTGFNPALVQGAGERDTMYWASHGSTNSDIVITRLKDSETAGDIFTRTISPYLNTERGSTATSGTCPLPDATDPCKRINDAINIGYSNGVEVGWLWNVRQGSGFPFPHIRAARFSTMLPDPNTGKLNPLLIDEPDIWSPTHAWIYPALGINSANAVGLSAYSMGGGEFPRAAAALIDDVAPDSDWVSLFFHGIVTSDSGVTGNTWGDFQAVRPYGDCTRTWAGAVHSMQGGTTPGNAQHRFAWFGRERDGCPDLAVVGLSGTPTTVSTGHSLLIAPETQNIGSGLADASTTRFYLSRDAALSADDRLLDAESRVPALDREGSSGQPIAATAPNLRGTFYLLGCADDRQKFDEISDTNNCMAAAETVVIEPREVTAGVVTDFDVGPIANANAGSRLALSVQFRLPAGGAKARPRASLYLASRSKVQAGMIRIGSVTAPRSAGSRKDRRVRVRRVLRLSRKAPARRRQFLVACIGQSPRADRCIVGRRAIYVTHKQR